jgi:hypothetical protein
MTWLRSPYFYLLSGLGVAAFFYAAYVEWWRGQPRHIRTLEDILAMATVVASVPLLVALVSLIAAVWLRGKPMPGAIAIILFIVLMFGTLWGLAVTLAMG